MENSTPKTPKTIKPCPRCGSAAGAGNGGSLCKCKKGKAQVNSAPEPCDAPIGKSANGGKTGGCGCGKK
jgi:hypothetical protein